MPAHKLAMARGDVYWVGRDISGRTLVHSPARQMMDFWVIQLHVVGRKKALLVDRLWPRIFSSLAMTHDEICTAVMEYLDFLSEKMAREKDELARKMSGQNGRKAAKKKTVRSLPHRRGAKRSAASRSQELIREKNE